MHGKPTTPALLFAIFALLCPLASQAADAWIEIKSPNFIVLSNTSDRRARDIAWQLEQIRAALLAGFPWARARLDRPVQVIAAKDEATMKALAPQVLGAARVDSSRQRVRGGTRSLLHRAQSRRERRQSGQRQSLLLLVLDV